MLPAPVRPDNRHLRVLHADDPLFTGKLNEGRRVLSVGRGGIKAGRRVRIPDVGLHHILHLDHARKVMIGRLRLHGYGLSQKYAQQIHGVDGLVDERASALRLQPSPPAALRVIGLPPVPGDDPSRALDLPEPSGSEQLPDEKDAGIIPVLEAEARASRAFRCRPRKRVQLLFGNDGRLFTEYVDPSLQRVCCHRDMQVMGRADVKHIRPLLLQHLLQGRVGPASVFFRIRRGPFRTDIRGGAEAHSLQPPDAFRVYGSDIAAADDHSLHFPSEPPLP